MLRACCILLSYIRISELLVGHYMLLIYFLIGDLFLHMLWAKGIIKKTRPAGGYDGPRVFR